MVPEVGWVEKPCSFYAATNPETCESFFGPSLSARSHIRVSSDFIERLKLYQIFFKQQWPKHAWNLQASHTAWSKEVLLHDALMHICTKIKKKKKYFVFYLCHA